MRRLMKQACCAEICFAAINPYFNPRSKYFGLPPATINYNFPLHKFNKKAHIHKAGSHGSQFAVLSSRFTLHSFMGHAYIA